MTEQPVVQSREAAWRLCYTCRDYARERRDAIAGPLAEKARREACEVTEVVDAFMLAAHARHVMTGEPLRPGGPTRVTNPDVGRLLATYAMLGAHATPPADLSVTEAPTYGLCTACRSVEVALVEVTGTRDLSSMGESAEYPVGYGCEVCA